MNGRRSAGRARRRTLGWLVVCPLLVISIPIVGGAASLPAQTLRFDFGGGPAPAGWIRVDPDTRYRPGRAYGLSAAIPVEAVARDAAPAPDADFLTCAAPFRFVVDVPEGNYRVRVRAGDPTGTSVTTIKAEARRLMVKEHHPAPGAVEELVFCVNVRTPALADGATVRINDRERDHPNWDRHLSLEFSDRRPCIAAVEIAPAPDAVTLFLAGDSTVTDQKIEPWCAWGQMLPAFFAPSLAVANHAESGRTLDSFRDDRRWRKILDILRPGDFVMMQFGHNDMKQTGEGKGPFLNFRDNLHAFVAETRAVGAIPVLVTPMHRRRFDEDGHIVDTFGDYPEAVRQVAAELAVPLLDLHRDSRQLFEALGPEGSRQAFVHYPANTFPGQAAALKDDSHFSPYGAYQLARCLVEQIRAHAPALAAHLRPGLPACDPAAPEPFASWRLPASPTAPIEPPEGS